MSRILLLANLNCDHVLSLSEPLVAGPGCNMWIRGAGSAVALPTPASGWCGRVTR